MKSLLTMLAQARFQACSCHWRNKYRWNSWVSQSLKFHASPIISFSAFQKELAVFLVGSHFIASYLQGWLKAHRYHDAKAFMGFKKWFLVSWSLLCMTMRFGFYKASFYRCTAMLHFSLALPHHLSGPQCDEAVLISSWLNAYPLSKLKAGFVLGKLIDS